ncbi:hypothetical protein [Cupriavidus oxalaticus]|uniref:hypothetical protein n=1 Tax=Cupriavidus oxalaticus TaxID=96344 RepID=UPI003211E27A
MQVYSYDAGCLMVKADMGIGILPVSLARRYARTMGIRVVTLDAPWAHRKLKIASVPTRHYRSRRGNWSITCALGARDFRSRF